MKTIYFGHSRSFDYEKEWYEPIRSLHVDSEVTKLFPHDPEGENRSTKELFESGCNLFVAEVSYPSTGLGIELGYADLLHVPIICFSKEGTQVSGSLKRITSSCIEYVDASDLQEKLRNVIKEL